LDAIGQRPLAPRVLEDFLLVTEDHITWVLTIANGAHRFIEELMWRSQMEERHNGVASGVISAQLHHQGSTTIVEVKLLAVVYGEGPCSQVF
jgi:hypothetical protein